MLNIYHMWWWLNSSEISLNGSELNVVSEEKQTRRRIHTHLSWHVPRPRFGLKSPSSSRSLKYNWQQECKLNWGYKHSKEEEQQNMKRKEETTKTGINLYRTTETHFWTTWVLTTTHKQKTTSDVLTVSALTAVAFNLSKINKRSCNDPSFFTKIHPQGISGISISIKGAQPVSNLPGKNFCADDSGISALCSGRLLEAVPAC